jgi:hypothetical protein
VITVTTFQPLYARKQTWRQIAIIAPLLLTKPGGLRRVPVRVLQQLASVLSAVAWQQESTVHDRGTPGLASLGKARLRL